MSSNERPNPPRRIRVTGLQEAQLRALVAMSERVSAEQLAAGMPAELALPLRSEPEFADLRRKHDVYVAEADHEPAGYLAWRDEAPGVAVLTELVVAPELQRFGIATRLLRDLGDKASRHGIEWVICACFDGARPAVSFLAKRGFLPADAGKLPEPIHEWRAEAGREFVADGLKLWWAKTDGLGLIPGLPRPEPE